jgi:hypothetical protein
LPTSCICHLARCVAISSALELIYERLSVTDLLEQSIRDAIGTFLDAAPAATAEPSAPRTALLSVRDGTDPSHSNENRKPHATARTLPRFLVVAVSVVAVIAAVSALTFVVTHNRVNGPTSDGSTVSSASPVVVGETNTNRSDSTSPVGVAPLWYRAIQPYLPEGFSYAALTFSSESSMRYLTIDPVTAKAIDIEIWAPEPDAGSIVPGTFFEKPFAIHLVGPSGIRVRVTCGIGAGRIGDDKIKDTDYCNLPEAGAGVVARETLQRMAEEISNSFPVDQIGRALGEPSTASIDIDNLNAIAEPVLGPYMPSRFSGQVSADIFLDYGNVPSTSTPGTYANHDDATIRIVQGVYPQPTETVGAAITLYDNLAAGWVINSAGTAVRLTISSDPATVTAALPLLHQFAVIRPTTVTPADPPGPVESATTAAQPETSLSSSTPQVGG